MKDRKQENKNVRTSKVQYSSRPVREWHGVFQTTGYTQFPRISIAGNWLEELGFHIGDKLQVECGDGCLKISLANVGMVCEENAEYEAPGARKEGV